MREVDRTAMGERTGSADRLRAGLGLDAMRRSSVSRAIEIPVVYCASSLLFTFPPVRERCGHTYPSHSRDIRGISLVGSPLTIRRVKRETKTLHSPSSVVRCTSCHMTRGERAEQGEESQSVSFVRAAGLATTSRKIHCACVLEQERACMCVCSSSQYSLSLILYSRI